MPEPIIYDDTYVGPRWRYGHTLRPVTHGPQGFIVLSGRPHPDFPSFGTADYPRQLTAFEVNQFDLVLLETIP